MAAQFTGAQTKASARGGLDDGSAISIGRSYAGLTPGEGLILRRDLKFLDPGYSFDEFYIR